MSQSSPVPDNVRPLHPGPKNDPRATTWSPLGYRLFRALWIATLVSNFGTWVQQVGAAWLMTSIAPSPDMVALVQVATALPALLFSLPGGAVSDVLNRRIVLLVSQSWMLAASAVLAALDLFGAAGAWTLLGLTFMLGVGGAFSGPAWQAAVGDLVPRREIPSAVALNSVGFNIARSLGPALGGLIVAAAGAKAAFLFNALSYIGVIAVLFVWSGSSAAEGMPRERIFGAIAAGLRFGRQSQTMRTVLVRCVAFVFPTSSVWALLPVIARQTGGGPVTYGLLLGSLGIGAVFGAGGMTALRRRFGNEALVAASGLAFSLVLLVLGHMRMLPVLMVLLLIGGASWMGALSSLNTTVQLAVPGWVKGRALSIYLMSLFGGLTVGSWFWGRIATDYSVAVSLTAAGVLGLLALGLRDRYRLPGFEDLDLTPAEAWPEPVVAFAVDPEAGPVLITVEYRVLPERTEEFVLLMQDVRRIRRRDGASDWDLYRDVEAPDRWLETFRVNSWAEHLRQHRRGTVDDSRVLQRIQELHVSDGPPKVAHLIGQEPIKGQIIPMPDQPAG